MANPPRVPRKRLRPRSEADVKRIAKLEANRQVTITLKMRHFINGVTYGPGTVKCSHNLAQGMLATEGHAGVVEEQFQGSKAAIIGPRRGSGHTVKEVPVETFDSEYANANPAGVVSGANQEDRGSGNQF